MVKHPSGARIIIACQADSQNLGDQAIAFGELALFREVCDSVSVLGLTSFAFPDLGRKPTPPRNSRLGRMVSFSTLLSSAIWASRQVVRGLRLRSVLRSADGVVIGGGSLLMNNRMRFPISIAVLVAMCRLSGTPVAFLGISRGGADLTGAAKFIFRVCLRYASTVYVRDLTSQTLLEQAFGVTASVCPDFGLFWSSGEAPASSQTHSSTALPRVLINVCEQPAHVTNSEYECTLATLASYIDSEPNRTFTLFTTGWQSDAEALALFASRLKTNCQSVVPSSLAELGALLTDADVVVGIRLHSVILSLAAGVRCVGISADSKMDGFLRTVNQEDWLLHPQSLDVSTLAKIIDMRLAAPSHQAFALQEERSKAMQTRDELLASLFV
jgi:polysaccharide pyruvyl transferase WcaK-like protein